MSSRDLFWFEDIVKEDFKKEHKTLELNGDKYLNGSEIEGMHSLSLMNGSTLHFKLISLNEVWFMDRCKAYGNIKLSEDFKARNDIEFIGNIEAFNIHFGHSSNIKGDITASDRFELGNNCCFSGNITCKILRIGENTRLAGSIKAEEIYAGSNSNISSDIICGKYCTGENSKLMGKNKIGFLYSQNGMQISGGEFTEIHVDDNFRSNGSISGKQLVMDNCVIIEGNVTADEYIRMGDNSRVNGSLSCGGYYEYGPGTKVSGEVHFKTSKMMPPSSAKIRTGGRVRFPEY